MVGRTVRHNWMTNPSWGNVEAVSYSEHDEFVLLVRGISDNGHFVLKTWLASAVVECDPVSGKALNFAVENLERSTTAQGGAA